MIKSTISQVPLDTPKYPCLRESKRYIVLFTTETEGTVVHVKDPQSRCKIGYYEDCWISKKFTKFNGVLTLGNGNA